MDTIAAMATPIGAGGVGIIRISGPAAREIGEKIFRHRHATRYERRENGNQGGAAHFTPRRLQIGLIVNPKSGFILDEALFAYMPAPHSYTCEDVVEIQAHGGAVGLNSILNLVIKEGARLAEPGEFTKRAFLNGRIDLTQAEAIIDVINAKTERSLQLASEQLNGSLREIVENVRGGVTQLLTELEAAIDFPDDCEDISYGACGEHLKKVVITPLEILLKNYEQGHLIREGIRIIIMGRPNVGKSSLMNRLLKKDRAIVTEVPGTTRDSLEETLNINGVPVVLVDTAGVRESVDPVESVGILRAERLAGEADLVLFMIDAGAGVTDEDIAVYHKIAKKSGLLVINKIDLEEKDRPVEIPGRWFLKEDIIRISVRYEKGIDRLKERIYHYVIGKEGLEESRIVPNLRQKSLIEKGLHAACRARKGLAGELPPELLAIDLKETQSALNQVVGKEPRYDILEHIFGRFCIGK